MKTREQVIRTNARKREFRWTARGAIKAIIITILVLILLIAAIFGVFFGLHYTKTQKEQIVLETNRMYKTYDVDGIDTNIYVSKGNDTQHTIVSIADIGDNTFGVYTNMVFNTVKNEVTVVNIDRPGYGMSADTTEERTVDNIIKHYRASLEAVNIDEPVVLFTYGFGSVYAIEWAKEYPDEIKAIVNINGTIISKDNEDIEAYETEWKDYLYALGNNIGVQRMFYDKWFNDMHRELSLEEEECVKIFNTHSAKTFAQYSEMELKEDNFNTVLNRLEQIDVPMIYIATENAMECDEDVANYVEFMNALSVAKDEKLFYDGGGGSSYDKFIVETIAESTDYQETVLNPYIETYGNAKIVKIPGYAQIYKHKVIAMDNFIKDLVKLLDKDVLAINVRYENEYPETNPTVEETVPVEPEITEPTNQSEN